MSVWDTYQDRINGRGGTKRNAVMLREKRNLQLNLPDNLSYHTVKIFDQLHSYNISTEDISSNSFDKEVSIINSDNLNEKMIISMPGDDIEHGSVVYWMDNYWLVTERDADTTIYTRAKMIQCNYLLRWVSDDNTICEQWCIIEDGTKYLTGEFEDRNFVVTRGDSRIAMTISRNDKTVKLGRKNRFLIDDPESSLMLAYLLTKPLKLGWSFNDKGVFKFVLQEVNTTDDDNQELRIADYYKHFPKENPPAEQTTGGDNPGGDNAGTTSNTTQGNGRKVWL